MLIRIRATSLKKSKFELVYKLFPYMISEQNNTKNTKK